jgi:hypothetical protein
MRLVARTSSIASVFLALAACTDGAATSDGGGGSASSSSTGVASETASLRVVHASPDAPAVDVYAKGVDAPLVTNLAYGDASAYLSLPPGTYDLELRAAPSSPSDPIAYDTGPVTLKADEKITAVAAGLLGSTSDSDKFRVLPLEEGFGIAGSHNAIVRVVHAGADAPSVGIDLDDDDAAAPEITGLDRFADSGASGVPITAGAARQIGITAGGAKVTAFTTPELPEGGQLFVIATGLLSSSPRATDGFDLLAVGPDGAIGFIKQNPVVFALHAGADAPSVDVFAGETELVDGISFGEIGGALQVPPGTYTLDFFPHAPGSARPSDPPAASASTGALEAGERYLAAATGLLAATDPSEKFRLVAAADGFGDAPDGEALLRVVHASADAPAVDVGVLNAEKKVSPVLVSNLSFGESSASDGFSITPGTTPIGVAPAGSPDPVASFHVSAVAGVRGFAVAAGTLDPVKGQSFRLLVVDTEAMPWTVATVDPQPL